MEKYIVSNFVLAVFIDFLIWPILVKTINTLSPAKTKSDKIVSARFQCNKLILKF